MAGKVYLRFSKVTLTEKSTRFPLVFCSFLHGFVEDTKGKLRETALRGKNIFLAW